MQHLGQARKVGWTENEIAAIEAGGEADGTIIEDPGLRTILAFVDACVAGSEVADRTFAEAREVLTPRHLATIIMLVGHYMMVARFLGILEIELDEHPDSWQNAH